MGKYSLENYEQYPTVKMRPKPISGEQLDLSKSQFNFITLSWKEFEPARGEFRLEILEQALNKISNAILMIFPDLPVWVKNHSDDYSDYLSAFIRKVGSYIDSDRRLKGVVISNLKGSKVEWNAYMDSFETLTLFADLKNHSLIHYLRKHNRVFGLLVTCNESNWIDCCESFAKLKLSNIWRQSPVILNITDEVCGPNVKREAYRWHASLSNLDLELGYNMTLRRLTYPESVSSQGSLPLRFWFVNTGSARVYEEFELWVQLKLEDETYELLLNAPTQLWLMGDLVHNEITQLPNMKLGQYTVSVGLFHKDQSFIQLNIDSKEVNGYYEVGLIKVEPMNEDQLLNIWDRYYPEGYYPLEDPAVPEQES
ncbi:DUF4832 domain-containing protein [Paenibacillus anaericanus]|uniref:DUF4832 domain-containing protein n=1 Tax=Paenibacillus anaericanus TaxID=170367 RepID=A0A3S1BK75_9BACL|nr:DUF4832 domain-containing protein [Paenibacillus anaericanus]RUT41396.1 DUF4832 domain-containing protein [Paenibacillus anaericanus]